QYNAPGNWAAVEALDLPNTNAYGDIGSAWAPSSRDGTLEWLALGFPEPVYSTGVTVRETYGNGFVTKIDAIDTADVAHTVWTGVDPSKTGSPVDFTATWAQTPYLVKGVRVWVSTNETGVWEEIDSMQLHGVAQEDFQWAGYVQGFSSENR